MSSVGELVEAGRSGIFGGEYRLSHLTGVCTKTYFARKWLSYPEFGFAQLVVQAVGRQKLIVSSLSSHSLSKNKICCLRKSACGDCWSLDGVVMGYEI